jgi:hypothetical protein
MARATVRIDNTVIELPPRLESIVRLLVQYQQPICYPETCIVELHCGPHGRRGGAVHARLVVPLEHTKAEMSLRPLS